MENFNFPDEKSGRTTRSNRKMYVQSRTNTHDIEEHLDTSPETKTVTLTESGIRSLKRSSIKPNALNRVAMVKRKTKLNISEKQLGNISDPQEGIDNKAAWNHTITVARTILSTHNTDQIENENKNGNSNSSESEQEIVSISPDIIVPVKINESVLKENDYKHKRLQSKKQENIEPKAHNKYSRELILEKILTPKQFPHLRKFVEEDRRNRNKDGEIVGSSEPIRSKIEHPGGMGKYIVLDPSNTDHSKYGFIYLDDETLVSNTHFYSFRPGKYIKPPAIREICNKTNKMKETMVLLEQRNKQINMTKNKTHSEFVVEAFPGTVSEASPETVSLDFKSLNLPDPEKVIHLDTHQLHFRGCWNAKNNLPDITSGQGRMGDFYIVSEGGSTEIDGEKDWHEADAICYDNNKKIWFKV